MATSNADATATLSLTVPPPNPKRKHTTLSCLNLIGGQGVPGPGMPKGTFPNSPIRTCRREMRGVDLP